MSNAGEQHNTLPPFTSEARELLDRVLGELADDITALAVKEHASRFASQPEIGKAEVIYALKKLNIPIKSITVDGKNATAVWRSFAYGLTGLVFATSVTFAVRQLGLEQADRVASLASIIAGAVALAVAFVALFYTQRSAKAAQEAEKFATESSMAAAEAEFILLWVNFEKTLRNLAVSEGVKGPEIQPPSLLLRNYAKLVQLQTEDVDELLRLLNMRNSIVHAQPRGSHENENLPELTARLRFHMKKAKRVLS